VTAHLAILCPGQGSQHPGMLDLATETAMGAELLRSAGERLGWNPLTRARAGAPEIFANAVAQPLVCAAELATWVALRPLLPPPRAVLGYSLGELAAHAVAGGLGAEDAVVLAVRRAAAMDAVSPPGAGLVALRGLPLLRVEALAAAAGAEVAIVNGPDHVVVGGRVAALAALEELAARSGATAVRLPISVPAHTSLLAAAVEPFARALEETPLGAPAVPVLAGTTAAVVGTREEAVAALSRQLAARVEWARCVLAASELGCKVMLELGPGNALARMAGELLPGAAVRSVADFRSAAGVARWVERALAAT
jgi:[acyl-carrier-protein] S-malonyltransferase